MKKALVVALPVVLSILVSACSKSDDNKNGNSTPVSPQAQKQNLNGKSVQEVLDLKYNKAEFKCALWIQVGEEINLSVSPNDSFVVDLKNGFTLPQDLVLEAQTDNLQLTAKLEVNSVSILNGLHHTDVDGTVTKAENTPTIGYAFNAEYKISLNDNQSIGGSISHSKREQREKVRDVVLNDLTRVPSNTTQDGVTINQGPYRNYVECTLETEIKPEYQDEFQIEQKN